AQSRVSARLGSSVARAAAGRVAHPRAAPPPGLPAAPRLAPASGLPTTPRAAARGAAVGGHAATAPRAAADCASTARACATSTGARIGLPAQDDLVFAACAEEREHPEPCEPRGAPARSAP